ncbi:MAG: DNA polymerase I [Cytophagaceae bacterium]|jgi:DNA polymerase-1|nr:DNA polymerase I [Cytophagaceae bacterium]
MNKLFLLDAMALIYRAHFAFSKNPRITSTGLNTGAVFGFTNSLLEIISKEKPSHIAVAIDMAAPTFRHENFTNYKANRQEQPEDITLAIPYVERLLKAMNIPLLGIAGYEADDVIGTIAKKVCGPDTHVYMMTMDKDYMQLVNEYVFLYRPAYMGNDAEVYTVAKVLERFGVERIDQVRDILGLQGDAVDNIPGIPGIGEKTAQKLIAQFGSVENLIANASELKGKLKENVETYADQGLLSKELATIHCDVPIDWSLEEMKLDGYNAELLEPLLDELEFRTLKKRLLGNGTVVEEQASKPITKSVPQQTSLFASVEAEVSELQPLVNTRKTLYDVPHEYTIIEAEGIDRLLFLALQQSAVCFDTETTSLQALEAEVIGLALSWKAGEAYYIPFPNNFEETKIILHRLAPLFQSTAVLKIGQNIKYDLLVLGKYGVQVKGKLFDTMIAHYLLDPESRHNMDALAEQYLNYTPISIETLIGKKGVKQKSMRSVEVSIVAEYAAEDADVTYQLYTIFEPLLKEKGLIELFETIEMPLSVVLTDMELAGISIDTTALQLYSKELEQEVKKEEAAIYALAGVTFNIASPKQLGDVLFERLQLDPKAKKTKTGQYATGEDVLLKLEQHPIIKHILDYRELQKLKSTYVDALPELLGEDKRVHTSFNQTVAATGRLSSTNPNLQNIPIRTDRGREIRKAFVARDEHHKIVSADYSQIELRIMASFSKDKAMLEAFQQGQDIHTTTAAKVFNVSTDAVTSDMRRKAKMVNFGIIYGISAFGLAQRLDIPRKEAADIIDAYFLQFPGVKKYMDNCIHQAREVEYVETVLGRRRYLRDINSRNMTIRGFAERNAINAPIQGSAADLIKAAMIRIHGAMKEEKMSAKMVLQVHDELVFDVPLDEIEMMKKIIQTHMTQALSFDVPLEVDIGVGQHWLEAH